MLVVALAATLVGFVLLVAALLTGVLWLAIACVVVCVIGVGFLVGDLLGLGRSSSAATESDAAEAGAHTADEHTGDGSEGQDDVGTSDQEQVGDWSARADREEDPATGDRSEDHPQDQNRHGRAASEAETGEIPRIMKHGRRDDPPTEEFFLDKPR